MKSLFICCEESIKKHIGEEYDEILLVKKNVSSENMEQFLPRIKDAIRLTNSLLTKDEVDKSIIVTLDAPGPFFWMCQQLQVAMKAEENISIKLPQVPEIKDVEPVQ
jgi:hypothetical protein